MCTYVVGRPTSVTAHSETISSCLWSVNETLAKAFLLQHPLYTFSNQVKKGRMRGSWRVRHLATWFLHWRACVRGWMRHKRVLYVYIYKYMCVCRGSPTCSVKSAVYSFVLPPTALGHEVAHIALCRNEHTWQQRQHGKWCSILTPLHIYTSCSRAGLWSVCCLFLSHLCLCFTALRNCLLYHGW